MFNLYNKFRKKNQNIYLQNIAPELSKKIWEIVIILKFTSKLNDKSFIFDFTFNISGKFNLDFIYFRILKNFHGLSMYSKEKIAATNSNMCAR